MRAFFIVLAFAVAYAVVQILGRSTPLPSNWGSHHYGFLSGTWLAVGGAGAVLLVVLGWLRCPLLRRVRLPGSVGAVLLAVAGAALYWFARERAVLMGDGGFWIEGFAAGSPLWHLEPGAVLTLSFLDRVLGGNRPELTLAVASVACGALYLLAAVLFAREAAESAWGRTLVIGLLALAAVTRLFTGYVETHPLLAAVVMFYLVLTVRYVRGRGGLVGPVALGAIAPLFHPAALFLLPSLVYALSVGPRAADGESPGGSRWAALLFPVGVLGAAAFLIWRGPASLAGTLDYGLGKILPLGASSDPTVAYSLFSGAHLHDFLQEQILFGPFGALFVFALLILGAHGRLGREGRFLLWAAVPGWVFSFFFSHDLGAARDWGVFAPAAIPFLLVAGLALARLRWPEERPRLAGLMAGLVLGASFFHLLPWIGVNLDEQRSVGQLAVLNGPGSTASPFARSYAYEEIGAWYLDHDIPDAALTALREATDADTTNIRAAGNLAALLVSQGEMAEAALVLETSAHRAPQGELLYYRLGNAYHDIGQLEDAVAAYEAALNVEPRFRDGYRSLAAVHRRQGNVEAARDVLLRAREQFPDDTEIMGGLAIAYEDLGEQQPAVDLYRAILEILPEDTGSAFNLGRLLLAGGDHDGAIEMLSAVVERQPTDAEAWTNLGVARDLAGESEEARAAFERAISANPQRPEPYFNLARLSLVSGDTTRAEELMHTYAAMDSTSDWARLARTLISSLEARPR